MSRKWGKFDSESEIFPILEYRTVGDGRVRPSHGKLNGLRARFDDPIWRRIYPQNSWGCRCNVIQLTIEEGVTPVSEAKSKTREILKDFKKDGAFDMHPWFDEVIFKEFGKNRASYFNVPKAYSKQAKNNFGFPLMESVTGRGVQ